MFEVPGSNITTVYIEEEMVRGNSTPRYEYSDREQNSSVSSGLEQEESSVQL